MFSSGIYIGPPITFTYLFWGEMLLLGGLFILAAFVFKKPFVFFVLSLIVSFLVFYFTPKYIPIFIISSALVVSILATMSIKPPHHKIKKIAFLFVVFSCFYVSFFTIGLLLDYYFLVKRDSIKNPFCSHHTCLDLDPPMTKQK
jgi:hypothetical protein